MAALYLPVILGTGREGRQSAGPARFVHAAVAALAEVETDLIDVRNYARPVTKRQRDGAGQDVLAEKVTRADGYVIVSPEYNHGYPGELKVLLDTFGKEYGRKPVAICGVSDGVTGGVRVVEQLRQVVVELGMVPTARAVYFANAASFSAADGTVQNEAFYRTRVDGVLEELTWYAKVLKRGREGQ
jgi:NAD(P)H-dependent FMN reductase